MSSFRHEILGLRGLAVLAVLLFHISPSTLPGGFLGVDVFLVLSGFLITSQLQDKLENDSFSLSAFYLRRVFRLFPSLFATYAFYFPFCLRMYAPEDVGVIARSILAGILGFANIFFASIAGYFSKDLSVKPFLHTWSLSLEFQFYFFWPIVMLVSKRILGNRLQMRTLTFLLCIASFLAAHVSSEREVAFFFLPFRLFEFMVGSLLAFFPALILEDALGKPASNAVSFLAFAVLVASTVCCKDNIHHPGILSLLPCLSTATLIAAGSGLLSGRILSTPPLAFLGKISYSLYLFHWPLIVLVRYAFESEKYKLFQSFFFWVASLVLGFLNYQFVETAISIKTFSDVQAHRKRWLRVGASAFFIFAIFLVYSAQVRSEMRPDIAPSKEGHSLRELVRKVDQSWTNVSLGTDPSKFSAVGTVNSSRQFIVIGDSFAGQMHYFMHYVGLKYKIGFAIWWHRGCAPLFDLSEEQASVFEGGQIGSTPECKRFRDKWKEQARSNTFAGVIMVAHWERRAKQTSKISKRAVRLANPDIKKHVGYSFTTGANDSSSYKGIFFRAQLSNAVRLFQSVGQKVLIVSDPPTLGTELARCRFVVNTAEKDVRLRMMLLSGKQPKECMAKKRAEIKSAMAGGDAIISEVVRERRAFSVMVSRFICDNEKADSTYCRSLEGLDLLYQDPTHISAEGSLYLARRWIGDRSSSKVLRDFFNVSRGLAKKG